MSGAASRRLALEVLARVEDEGAYANLALPAALGRSGLGDDDRRLVTDLVYGTLRRRRSVDHLVGRFLTSEAPPAAQRALRLGAYQLVYRDDLPDYAVVSATVAAAPKRFRGLANAVLRKVASAPVEFPDDATRLSYPDWVLERLVADLGREDALGALEAMDEAPSATVRDDGYVQDLASQWVAAAVGAGPGQVVADLCAAPGGKATALAATGARVVAADLRPARAGLVAANAARLGASDLAVLVADAAHPPLRPAAFDRVLLDAPCSGLGVLRRRPDARWRLDADTPERLSALQRGLLTAAAELVGVGGELTYSVCTLTAAESTDVDAALAAARPDLEPLPPPDGPWRPWGRGAILLPQDAGTDGMCIFRYRRRPAA
ncbi:MAG: transcription antitermination factor NusB [Microthrixaceae bacterium]